MLKRKNLVMSGEKGSVKLELRGGTIPDLKDLVNLLLQSRERRSRAMPGPSPRRSLSGRFQLKVNWTGRGLRQAAPRPISDSPGECRATRITDSQIGGLK